MKTHFPGRWFQSLSALHWFVLALSLALTLIAWHVSSRINDEKANLQFEHEVEQITEQLKDRMANYAFALVSGVGVIHSQSQGVSRPEWRMFSGSLALQERLPGINGIGVIYRVPPDQLESFIADQRLLRPEFNVHPPHEINDHWPIAYIEPEASNGAAIGLDMAHETNRYTAAKKAMITGATQITGPIVLVQDAEKTPGFLFYQPFYSTIDIPEESQREAEFRGLVYAPFIMHKLLEGTLANVNRRVQLRISDQGSVLYDELVETNDNYDPNPMFETSDVIPMYGRQWHFDIQTTRLFKSLTSSRQPWVILIAGLIINALILAVFLLFIQARRRAEVRADDMARHYDDEAKKLTAVLNTVSDAIVTTDEQGKITSSNPAADRLFGAGRIGEPIVSLFTDSFFQLLAEEASQNQRRRFETLAFDLNNDSFPAHVGVEKAELGNQTLYTYTVRDLSMEKSADTAKNQFVSTVSHELRTPLTAISGAVALLDNQIGKTLEQTPRKMIDIIHRNTERLSLLVSDLLDIEGFTSGSIRLSKQPSDLSQIALKAINDCATYASSFDVTLELDDRSKEKTVIVDRDRIGQVLLNLISNAIKFSPEGARVRVELANDAPETITAKVIDSGEGIPDNYRKRAFSRFSQVDSSDAKQKAGTGLGLSICKAIVDLHDGIIDYETELGTGSTFYFSLALATETEKLAT